jgi:protein-tyrosine phosphatase
MMVKTKILFVCTGNICRSPGAEAVFNSLIKNAGIESRFEVDSAGTSGWHAGEKADHRMQSHAVKRGYNLTSIARKFTSGRDFDNFDIIIAMDDSNVSVLKSIARNSADLKKLFKITDFRKDYNYDEIPDPYYGGDDGFELVLDLLEDACEGLLEKLNHQDLSTI